MALSTVFHSINSPDKFPFSHCSSGLISAFLGPHRLTFTWWGCCGLCIRYKPIELAPFCGLVSIYVCGSFNCISFHKFFWQLSAFSHCSFGLIFALVVLSTTHLFMKLSFSPDKISLEKILCGWLGLKHKLTNCLFGLFNYISLYENLLQPWYNP